MPQRVKIVTDTWLPESGLVTDALKLKRKAIEQKYRRELRELYSDQPKTKSAKRTRKTLPGSEQEITSTDVVNNVTTKKDQ